MDNVHPNIDGLVAFADMYVDRITDLELSHNQHDDQNANDIRHRIQQRIQACTGWAVSTTSFHR